MARASTPQPRVLRVAVVVDGVPSGEVHQEAPGSLSVGTDYRSDVLVFGAAAPMQHPMFDYRDGGYFIDLPAGVRGKLVLGKRRASVGALRKKMGQGDRLRLRLPPGAKGKLLLGETTLLFQFDRPKPVPPKPPFPREFRARPVEMWEQRFRYSVSLSAALLGGFFVYMANAPLPEGEIEIEERFLVAVGSPKVRDKPEPEEEETEEDVLAEKDEEVVEKKEKPEPKKLTEKPEKFSKKAMAEARGVGVARVLGTYGGPGEGTVFDVIQDTENNLGELFAQGMTTTVLADGGDISAFVPGGEGISSRGSAVQTEGFETGEGPELAGKEGKKERVVKASTKTSGVDSFGGGDKKALKATINHRQRALKACFESALRTQPGLGGKITFTIEISVMGTVTSVSIDSDTVGSDKVSTCTKARIKGWRFPMNGAEEPAEVTWTTVFSGQ